jgi:hypothetical protein
MEAAGSHQIAYSAEEQRHFAAIMPILYAFDQCSYSPSRGWQQLDFINESCFSYVTDSIFMKYYALTAYISVNL